jgi:hypothetical protein
VFFIPSYIWLAMLTAVALGGLAWAIGRLPSRPVQITLNVILMLLILYVGVLPTLMPRLKVVQRGQLPFLGDQSYVVNSNFDLRYKQLSRIVGKLEPNTIIFLNWDMLSPYWYAADIEQGRTDLRFVEQDPHDSPGFPASAIEFIRANIDTHPVYLSAFQPEGKQAGFTLISVEINFVRFYKVEKP